MSQISKNPEKFAYVITLITLIFLVCMGATLVLFRIQPFWVDEWFIISSLKTKSIRELFGQLNFMQQFPRVYLALIKSFSSFFNYSYFSLRFPSFMVSVATIVLSYRVMNKIYDRSQIARYLFVLILVSSFTFTEYFVEMKQYPMDILMSVVALWQLIELVRVGRGEEIKTARYVLLCTSFLIVPFFSYTYPIAIVPAYVVVFLQSLAILRNGGLSGNNKRIIARQWAPLLLGIIGIFGFYAVDARHLASDAIMYERWSFLLVNSDHKFLSFLSSIYSLFSQTGNGIIFENLFGVLGICGLLFGISATIKSRLKINEWAHEIYLRVYSCLLLLLTLVLFLCKKLPLGTPRLNAFTTPSIAILVIYVLQLMLLSNRPQWQKMILPLLLYAGVAGNVFTHYTGYFTTAEYKRQAATYVATENAIRLAQDMKIPILITQGVAYPYAQAAADAGAPDPAVWVLKTFPAYDIHMGLPVYAISDTASAGEYLAHLPPNITRVLAGDGISFRTIERRTKEDDFPKRKIVSK